MSKKIKLLQDGRDKTLPKVAKIETQLAEGKNCYWIPEDEVPLGILQVSTDGVYNAASDPNGPFYGYSEVRVSGVGTREMGQLAEITITKNGSYAANVDQSGPFYGYSKVIVNVPTSGEGGDPTSRPTISGQGDDGNDEVVGTDDDGNLVYEKIPSSIKVITTPDNLEYEDGQSIVFDGLYVKAYLKDGTEWGVVPNTDLIKPVRVAEAESSYGGGGANYVYSAGTRLGRMYNSNYDRVFVKTNDGDAWFAFANVSPYMLAILVSRTYEGAYETITDSVSPSFSGTFAPDHSVTINGTSYYVNTNHGLPLSTTNPPQGASPIGTFSSIEDAAEHIVGSADGGGSNQQTIPLQWKRPGDKKVLETSFTITVRSSGDNNTSGSTTPGGTNIDVPQ